MGMYDNILGHVRCPVCGFVSEVYEQIKWEECIMDTFILDDIIDLPDGVYTTTPNRDMVYECKNCKNEIPFEFHVKYGRLAKIKASEISLDILEPKRKEYREFEEKRREEFFNNLRNKIDGGKND